MSGSSPVWIDRCACGHIKDNHQVAVQGGKVWAGPCRSCGCLRFSKSGIEEEPAATVDAPRGIDAAVRPGDAPFADTSGEGPGSAPVGAPASEVQPIAELAVGGLVEQADPPLLTAETGCSLFVPLKGISPEMAANLAANVLPAWPSGGTDSAQQSVSAQVSTGHPADSLADFGESLTPAERDGFLAAALDDRPIEEFNAWRCPVCGMRSFRQGSCHNPLEPVRVEIYARSP